MSRDLNFLFVHRDTFDCAIKHHCIPCLYKIFITSNALPPNVRPENCPRSSSRKYVCHELYSRVKSILTLGDGDFSFSLSIRRGLSTTDDISMTCTSFEAKDTILCVYPNAMQIINELVNQDCEVIHNVDATTFSNISPTQFDLIIWNFPCIAHVEGADAQVSEIDQNRTMLTQFFTKAQSYMSDLSEIHITHKTLEPFSWWRIVDLAVECGLAYRGSYVFDKYLFPGYTNRKALDNKSFPCHDAQVGRGR